MKTVMCFAVAMAVALGAVGCASSPDEEFAPGERYTPPAWYKLRFMLRYPDERKYEGECSWAPWFDKLLRHDVLMATGSVLPGKILTSVREVHGPRISAFTPNGTGTMTYPDGSAKTGRWRDGEYAGEGP